MEIKRNIFESSAKMPAYQQHMAVPMQRDDLGTTTVPYNSHKFDSNVRHAPIPRIGEQK